MTSNIYTDENSAYFKNNPTWDVADSPWKARCVFTFIQRHSLRPKTVAEVGCGAGEILNQLHAMLPDDVQFSGFDIAPDAIELAKPREKERLGFYNENIFLQNGGGGQNRERFDFLLVMDVIEHVEDCFDFIRQCCAKADYVLFKIPLDLNVLDMLRNRFYSRRKSVGHIHYFTKDTALLTLRDCGCHIIDWQYRSMVADQRPYDPRILYRKLLFAIAPDFAVRLFGGYSLFVLTAGDKKNHHEYPE